MSRAAVPPPRPAAATAAAEPPPTVLPVKSANPLVLVLKALASLRVTLVLFVLAILLVFFGTLAQVDEGIWTALTHYFRCWVAWIPLQTLVRFGQVFFGVPETARLVGSFPLPGGFTIGAAMLINLLAAHAVRFKMSWKRSGILITHAGLILLLLGEAFTAFFAVEGRMTIENGGSSNYVEDHHRTELAVLERKDDRTDNVTVVPGAMLKAGSTISSPELPFDIEVVRYMSNSAAPRPLKDGDKNLATAGDGRTRIADKRDEVSGTDPDQSVDMPAAYVTLKRKDNGSVIGTYLVSTWWSDYWLSMHVERPQEAPVDGKTYRLVLRAKRDYKPYTIRLREFRHDVYPGTDVAKNFSSEVTLDDPSRNVDRDVLIKMNEPMRHGFETFYQSGVLPGDGGTILQVVYNPGAVLPYVSCFLVAFGLLVHFGITLVGFLNRRAAP